MAFVKLDCGILDSTLWSDREAREVFITCLLMAEPIELRNVMETVGCDGFTIPTGWYGFVPASGPGIARRAGLPENDCLSALKRLAAVDVNSRTPLHDGRRLVRVDGGFIILNYEKYRQKDHTAAERSRRWREKHPSRVSTVTQRVTTRSATQAEAEAEAESEVQSSTSNPAKDQPPQLTLEVQTKDTRKPPSTQHSAFILGWCDNYKSKFGCDYKMEGGRDGKAVKKLLRMGIQMIDLLEIAKKAWNKMPSFEGSQSLTIHGFYERFNQIQIAVNGKINHATNQPNHQQRPNRNIGTANAEVDPQLYAAAARRQSSTQ